MNVYQLVKQGCNIQIQIENTDTGVLNYFNEDSANIELIYNNSNNKITINILGVASYTTEDITENNVFYFNDAGSSVLIYSLALFNQYYALVFACATGGGGGGSVNAVTGTLPISSSGGANPNISINQANVFNDGYLTSSDWSIFNNKISGSGTATQIAFFQGTRTIGSDAQLFWDNTNKRLAVGTGTAQYKLDVFGSGRIGTTGSDTFRIGNYFLFDYGDQGDGINNSRMFSSGRIHIQSNATTGIRNFIGTLGTNAYTDVIEVLASMGDFSVTSGTKTALKVYGQILMPSGNTTINYFEVAPFINMVNSTYSGIVRGIYYNPKFQSGTILPTSHIAFENTSGDIIFGNLASNPSSITFVDNVGKLGISYLANDTALNKIYTIFEGGNTNGLSLDSNSSIYEFGIFGGDWYLRINSNSILLNGDSCGFQANGGASVIGDVSNYNNQSYFGVDDFAQKLIASGNLISTIGGASTDRIKITVGGNDYLIVLEKA